MGVILYELLSGKRAFDAGSVIGIIGANLKDDPAELPASVPVALQRIVRRCLEKEPSHRFQSAADLGFALQAISDAAADQAPTIPKRPAWPKWVSAAVIVFILAAGAYWAETRERGGNALHRPLRLSLLPPPSTSFTAYDRNGEHLIRIYDFARGTSTRLTDGISDLFPAFSPDAAFVAYTHNNSIFVVPSDGSRKPEQLRTGQRCIVNDWSGDRQHLIYMNFVGAHQPELDILDVRDHSNTVYAENGAEAQFSPDGKWVAYTAPGSGASPRNGNYYDSQVFVAPFPGPGGRIQISNGGGAQVRWRADGKEVYYISSDKKLMAVPIDTKSGKAVAGVPHVLFQTRIIAARIVLFQYAVAPDGKRFLINSLPSVGAAPLTVLAD